MVPKRIVSGINERIYLLGGNGYIGKNMLPTLTSYIHQNQLTVINRTEFEKFLLQEINHNFIVIFLGGESPRKIQIDHEKIYFEKIVQASNKLIEKLRINQFCKGLLYLSSYLPKFEIGTKITNEWGTTNPYHYSRLLQTLMFSVYPTNFPIFSLRLSNVFGGEGDVWSIPLKLKVFLDQEGDENRFDDTTITRDWIHVSDVVELIILTLNEMKNSNIKGQQIFNVGTGKSYSIDEILTMFGKRSLHQIDKNIKVRTINVDISETQSYFKWTPKTDLLDWLKND